MNLRAIIVEDEHLVAWALQERLKLMNIDSKIFESGLPAIPAALADPPDIIIVDYKLPDSSGIEILESLQSLRDKTLFFFMTAYGTPDISRQARELGATQYLTKPIDFDELSIYLKKVLHQRDRDIKLKIIKEREKQSYQLGSFISHSKAMKGLIKKIGKLVDVASGNILLLGETGTGKDTVARLIHEQSPRSGAPFIIVNCASLSESLLESELFGHERGAFTDAKVRKMGHAEMAAGGTIFLDEIGEIPINFQAKLLRFLETRTFYRVGGTREIEVNVRIIAATNRDLEAGVRDGWFREDLYYRLNVIVLELPALRTRIEDIRFLANHFIQLFNQQLKMNVSEIAETTLVLLKKYSWPGNIRELKNVIERIFLLEHPDVVEPWHLPRSLRTESLVQQQTVEDGHSFFEGRSLDEIEKYSIERALRITRGNQTKAANLLGITRDQIRYKMKKHNLD